MTGKKSVIHVEIPSELKKDFDHILIEVCMSQKQRIEMLIRQDVLDHKYLIKNNLK